MRANQGVARHFRGRRPVAQDSSDRVGSRRSLGGFARRQRATSVGAINDRGGWPRVNGKKRRRRKGRVLVEDLPPDGGMERAGGRGGRRRGRER